MIDPVVARKTWRTLEPIHGFVYFSPDAEPAYVAAGLKPGRMGYFASFMARPAIKSYYASGWHLHQSVVSRDGGENAFMMKDGGETLSPLLGSRV